MHVKEKIKKYYSGMLSRRLVEVEELTPTESDVYALNGVGKQQKEIADLLNSSVETVKTHMKNIKQKLGLQKDKELTAHFWCKLSGKNFEEVKKFIISSLLLLLFMLYLPFEQPQMREARTHRARRAIATRKID